MYKPCEYKIPRKYRSTVNAYLPMAFPRHEGPCLIHSYNSMMGYTIILQQKKIAMAEDSPLSS